MHGIIQTAQAPAAIGPYSQGAVSPPLLFTAGQIGLDPATGQLVSGDAAAQARQTLQNIRAIVEAAGWGLEDVVKTTLFLVDMQDFAAVNEVWADFFPNRPPARSTVAVAALPKGARVEIDAVAVRS